METLTAKEQTQVKDFIDLSKEDTYMDCLKNSGDWKHLEAATFEWATVLEIDTDNQQENIENCFIIKNLMDSMCNSIVFAAKREKRKLEAALDELSEARRNSTGTELSQLSVERVQTKIAGLERRIEKYRMIYSTIATNVYPEVIDTILPILPEHYAQNISRKFEPYQDRKTYTKKQQRKSVTASNLLADETLKKYGR